MKKLLIGLTAFAAVSLCFMVLFGEKLVTKKVTQIATERMTGVTLDKLPDGLHVFLCGAGSPMPDPKRAGPCCSGTLI